MGSAALIAHESWFTPDRFPYEWAFVFDARSLALIVGAVAIISLRPYLSKR